MQPIIISGTIQEFDGLRYYLCGRYFQRKGTRLHVAVWKYHNGEIQHGKHIHHADGDRSNNHISNLECVSVKEHLSDKHGAASASIGRRTVAKAIVAAVAWHGSAEGKKWHSEHFEKNIRPVMDAKAGAVCQECGISYQVSAAKVKQGKFCGPNCRARALRKRRKAEREA